MFICFIYLFNIYFFRVRIIFIINNLRQFAFVEYLNLYWKLMFL